jgi:site-specific DNA recombinase
MDWSPDPRNGRYQCGPTRSYGTKRVRLLPHVHVQLSAKGLERTGEAVLDELSRQQTALSAERERQVERLRRLEAEQTALLQAHYAGAVPLELLKREQTRMSEELTATRGLLEVSVVSGERLDFIVREASRRAADCHASYLASPARERRLMNQAFFKRVLVTEDGVVGWEYQEPFSTLMSAHSPTPHVAATLLIEHEDDQSGQAEDHHHSLGLYQRRRPGTLTRAFCRSGSKAEHLAEREGFEPSKRLDTP